MAAVLQSLLVKGSLVMRTRTNVQAESSGCELMELSVVAVLLAGSIGLSAVSAYGTLVFVFFLLKSAARA